MKYLTRFSVAFLLVNSFGLSSFGVVVAPATDSQRASAPAKDSGSRKASYTGKFAVASNADLDEKRKASLEASLREPFHQLKSIPGQALYIQVAYHLGQGTEVADKLLLDWKELDHFWSAPVMRALLDPDSRKNMSPEAHEHLAEMVFDVLVGKGKLGAGSFVANADKYDMSYDGSENHSAKARQIYLLGTQYLSTLDAFKDREMNDGRPMAEHAKAWTECWKRYFVDRALYGLDVEMNSGKYTKYTMAMYLNVHDLTIDSELKRLANNYLTLLWADKAQHYLPECACVGGIKMRTDKSKLGEGSYNYVSIFGWTNNAFGSHPVDLVGVVSDFRVPDVVTDIAMNKSDAFAVDNSWLGILDRTEGNDFYRIHYFGLDDQGRGGARRFSTVDRDFVLGSAYFSTQHQWSQIARQNRRMGITFRLGQKVFVEGIGTARYGKDYSGINGLGAKNAQVIWRDLSPDNNSGTRIRIDLEVYEQGSQLGQWWFAQVDDAYLALRTASGSGCDWQVMQGNGEQFTAKSGVMYFVLNDINAPVIMEAASADDYESFEAFQAVIQDNPVTYTANEKFHYKTESGHELTVYPTLEKQAQVNGKSVLDTLGQTYSSPYVSGMTPDDRTVTITGPSGKVLTLDLNLVEPTTDALEPVASHSSIGLIGDSTVADTYGWGTEFAFATKNDVKVFNFAKNGGTLDSMSKRLDALLKYRPDYVLIQFGHNDMKRYDTQVYAEKLKDYVRRVREAGSKPVVLSSVTRRTFDDAGKIKPTVINDRTLADYAKAAGAVSSELQVPFIDLNTISIEHHNKLGPDACAGYNFVPEDKTHFSPAGERAIASIVIGELKKAVPDLADCFQNSGVQPLDLVGFTPLFNGRDLTGWKNPYKHGEAKVKFKEIQLTADKKFFLVTEKQYSDFELIVELNLPEVQANSGVMFRCHVEPNRVYGYQAECDGSDRCWSAGIYDEGRRGWMWPTKKGPDAESSQAFFQQPEVRGALNRIGWNRYKITCQGNRIITELNGIKITDMEDDTDASGHIGIQHHGEKGQTYRFRNVYIKELTPAESAVTQLDADF